MRIKRIVPVQKVHNEYGKKYSEEEDKKESTTNENSTTQDSSTVVHLSTEKDEIPLYDNKGKPNAKRDSTE